MTVLRVCALALLLSGCGTIRMAYEAQVNDQHVRVEKSYPVGGAYKELCYITAIGLGGSCWFYTVMPTVEQKNQMREDALRMVAQKLGNTNIEPKRESVYRVSWDKAETAVTVERLQE
ncbi:MAG: hypothetical protein AB7G93_08515 [Bdellovibrionales bacterium]